MKVLLASFLVLWSVASTAQPCTCLDDYYFIKNHIEKNHGGFNKKIKSVDEPAYKKFTQELEEQIKKDGSEKYCLVWLKKYIHYLQDHHSNISAGMNKITDESDPAALQVFYQSPAYLSTEVIPLDSATIARKWSSERMYNPEGIYYTPDSTYIVALVKSKTPARDYAGVILRSKTKLWKPGQVKFELKQVNDSLFDAFISYRNHTINYEQVSYKGGVLRLNGWIAAEAMITSIKTPTDSNFISFRALDTNTALLSIRSFSASLLNQFDSAYRKIIPEIKKYPRLIIDIRNNPGGSDRAFSALIPFIYTDPYESDVMEYFSTPDNIKAYKEYDEALLKRNPPGQKVFAAAIATMKKTEPFTFIPHGSGKPFMVTSTRYDGYPLKVAVLYNRNCASSCESLLIAAMNSNKTILTGENSGGFTGYGNVMNIKTPCGRILSWTTTVYRNLWKYEFTGIPPQHRIPVYTQDWVEYTRELLAK